ncbi:MAG: hypothetical protein U0869_22855 [Chloroflexota bacterium]
MAIDAASPRSRRALLGASLGAIAAVAAQALGRPLPADAAGPALTLGENNPTDADTTISRNDGKSNVTLAGATAAFAAHAFSADGFGVVGFGQAARATGVAGRTEGKASQVAILATTMSGNTEGIALHAETGNGIAVLAECTGGEALHVKGMTVFSRSGMEAFAAGQASRKVTGYRMTADTLVVATIQGDVAGTWVRGVTLDVPGQSFSIRLNKAAPKALKVGWFIVN